MAVAVDISGAFDMVDWFNIIKNVQNTGASNSYIQLIIQLLISPEPLKAYAAIK